MNNKNEICRICHSIGTDEDPLFYPCRCSGSIKFTHQACLLEWLKSSGRTKCEVCGVMIGMVPLYKPNTPSKLSPADFYVAVSDIFKKYFQLWLFFFILINILGFFTPLVIFRVINIIFKFLVNGKGLLSKSIIGEESMLSFTGLKLFFEIFVGILTLLISISIIFLTFYFLEYLSKLEQPWWFKYNHPDEILHLNHSNNTFSVSNLIIDGISIFNNWVREDVQNGSTEVTNPVEEVQEAIPLSLEEEFPRLRTRLRLIISSNLTLENILYLILITFTAILIVTLVIIIATGMLTLPFNTISSHITSGPIGLMATNILFHYSLLSPIIYIIHTIMKNYNIYFFCRIFALSKFMLIISIEYILTPFLYGFLLNRFIYFIQTHDLYKSFFIFPISDDKFILYCIIGLINIFWIACFLLYIHGKMRVGFLFPLSDETDEINRFLGEILYEPTYFLLFRILKSYTKYIFFFLFIQTLLPYYISFHFFKSASNKYRESDLYQPKIEIYIIVHFMIWMFKRINFKYKMDILTHIWLEYTSYILDLGSFLLGRVPLSCGQEVTDRLGTYYFSSAHHEGRARFTCSAPFVKTSNFNKKVYIFIFGTIFTITFFITNILTTFTIIGFYSVKYCINERVESFHLSILIGIFVVLCVYTIIENIKTFIEWFSQNRNSLLLKEFIICVISPLTAVILVPYLNGTALRLIRNRFECKNGHTCLIFPSYDFIIGLIIWNMEFIATHLLPESFIINYPIFYSLRVSIRPLNFKAFLQGFIIPYLLRISLFISMPHLLIFGFGKSLGLNVNMQHILHNNAYFWLFCLFIAYFFAMMTRYIFQNISNYVKNSRYLIGHQLKNFKQLD